MKQFVNLTMISTVLIFSMLFSRESAGIKVETNPTIMNDGKGEDKYYFMTDIHGES